MFHKLLLNFTWWVNREDAGGRNLFQGGFLGLDNIGVFDLRTPLPFGGRLDQSDGTAWMAAYALAMMRMALELAVDNPVYEDLATKFFEHFLDIAQAMHGAGEPGSTGLWDERDAFYYDVLRAPGQDATLLRIRSVVGLLPIVAAEIVPSDLFDALPAIPRAHANGSCSIGRSWRASSPTGASPTPTATGCWRSCAGGG